MRALICLDDCNHFRLFKILGGRCVNIDVVHHILKQAHGNEARELPTGTPEIFTTLFIHKRIKTGAEDIAEIAAGNIQNTVNNGETYLGEVLGVYTSQHDLFLMPNRDAMSFDLLVVLFAFAFVIATGLTLQDCYKKYLSETNQ